ncbi:MAG: tetratricopeptide repeat protein [Cyanobacteriota bacterium]
MPAEISNFKNSRKTEKIAGDTNSLQLLGSDDEQRKIEEAKALEKISRNPTSDTAYLERGNIYLDKGKLDAAISEYKQCITINPRNYAALFNLALAYYRSKDLNEALKYYRKARQINPNAPEATLRIADIYYQTGDASNAKFEMNKYLLKNPKAKADPEIQKFMNIIGKD